jgi:hypothetical protein
MGMSESEYSIVRATITRLEDRAPKPGSREHDHLEILKYLAAMYEREHLGGEEPNKEEEEEYLVRLGRVFPPVPEVDQAALEKALHEKANRHGTTRGGGRGNG